MNTPHPAAKQLLDAARTLAAYQPTGPADLAHLLRTLNDLCETDTVLGHLGTALDTWADTTTAEPREGGERTADMLRGADSRLQSVAEYLDRAREATGHWDVGRSADR